MIKSPVSFAVAIAQRGKGEKAAKIFSECGITVQYIGLGHGTASSEIMDYLGLDEPEKDVVLGLALSSTVPDAFSRLGEEMGFLGSGTGIAFSLPVSSVNQGAADRINLPQEYERGEEKMSVRFEIIAVIVDKGLTDVVMDSAKAVGARGGTVLKCRDMSPDAERKVFGVTIRPDKEILMLVTTSKEKDAIMKAICSTVFTETEQRATAFSIPIDNVVGLHGA